MLKKERGITLIALIITIIVMLILTGVTVYVALNGGLIEKAKDAKERTQAATEKEQLLNLVLATLDDNGNFNLDSIVSDEFKPTTSDDEKVIYRGPSGKLYEVSKKTGAVEVIDEEKDDKEEDEEDIVQWLYLEEDGEILVCYNGNSTNLTLNSSEVKAEKVLITYDEETEKTTINKTGEVNQINLSDCSGIGLFPIEFLFIDEDPVGPEIINLNGKILDDNVEWPENVKEIKGLDGWTETDKEEFEGLKKLEKIELPSTLTRMGQENFSNCIALETIVLPDSIVYMDHGTFTGCTNLKNVTLPKGELTRIPDSTFRSCTSLETIKIPSNITEIDSWAFYNCTSLETVEMSSNIQRIFYNAFEGCTNLKTIELDRELSDAESTLGTEWIPNGVTVIYKDQSKTYNVES